MASLCYRSIAGYINEDDLPGLQSFLENKRAQVDDRDENGTTALMVAAGKGRIGFVKELLSHSADPNAEDLDSWSALLCAAKEGHADVCHELLEHGADIEHRDMGGWTAVMWATYKGRTDAVGLLLDRGADVNAHGNYHIPSLLWAAGRGYVSIVRSLISHGAKLNVGDKYGTTALVWACRRGHAEIAEALLRAGANVDVAGMYSWTALLVATQGNHIDVVNSLLEHKPNVNASDKDGCSALTIACKEGFYEIAVALMSAGAYINVQDRAGDTNLIHAVKGGHRGIVEALLKKYADVDIAGKDRKTALYMAVEKGNVAVVKMLLHANPDLEVATRDGDTALLKAVRSRNAEIVQLLLDKKAKVSAADKKGDTALHVAMRARSKAIVEILLRNPKNSQLLYRPNRAGETPYNIDLNHPKTILGQIFGARRLNTNEDNENMLGYDLYSSALADVLSEPSLSVPITVGLYAKWGSGKSFLLNKLREEMKNFAREWADPVFQFSPLLFLVVLHVATMVGVVVGLSTQNWIVGASVALTVVVLCYVFLASLWFASKRYDWDWPYNFNVRLTRRINRLRLILQIVFCHPPGAGGEGDVASAQPIRFYFTDQTRVSSTIAGENSVVQILGSLYDAIEKDYGAVAARLYRAFRPKPVKSSTWKWRKLCCLPYIVLFEATFVCLMLGVCALTLFLMRLYSHKLDGASDVELLSLRVIMIATALLLGISAVSNLYTWNRLVTSLLFSQRRQLLRAIAKLDTLKSEGFLQALRHEVHLMRDMVRCLDGLSSQQTRLVIIVDGLDSCEQDKVLLVLDAVNVLFSDTNSPFVVILAIDPHVIAKAVEINSRRLLNENNISGHSYLNNMVHLPFYLQNSGLRKVKVAQQTAQAHRKLNTSAWNETDENVNLAGNSLIGRSLSSRRLSSESALMSSTEKLKFGARKGSRKLKLSESVASSIGSNLNRVGGAQDLTKMLLTDDYFSDVNPRSMRRLMNVVYITGRLMKAFQIDFNWYRLASWINITEQWPFRTSWIIYHYDTFEENLDDSTPLRTLYEKVRPYIPSLKDTEPLLELDRDERKLDIFLSYHRSSLLVGDLKIFLPFTINLDPYLKKLIKEETQGLEDEGPLTMRSRYVEAAAASLGWNAMPEWNSLGVNAGKRSKVYSKQSLPPTVVYPTTGVLKWPYMAEAHHNRQFRLGPVTELPPEVLESKLSDLNIDGVCKLLHKIDGLDASTLARYKAVIQENNINGRVLLHCDLDELKNLLKMSFGDWEMFRVLIVSLREHELTSVLNQTETKSLRFTGSKQHERKASVPKVDKDAGKVQGDGNAIAINKNKQSVMEKQVTLEDQMICGALQTLNEEACEDVLEETEDCRFVEVDVPLTSVIPPSPDNVQGKTQAQAGIGDTDFVLLQSSPVGSLHWHPVSISVHGTAESLSDHSSRGSSHPPSPVVGERSACPSEEHPKSTTNAKKRVSNNNKTEDESDRPNSLHLSKMVVVSPLPQPKRPVRTRSKSIDNTRRHTTDTKMERIHKFKRKLLYSNPNLKNDTSDTESTPLVSEGATPLASPDGRRETSSNSTSHSDTASPVSHVRVQVATKYSRDSFSPTQCLNEHGAVSELNLMDDRASTSWFGDTQERSRTMSECADLSLSFPLEHGSRSLNASNVSLCSKYSQSYNHLFRQDALDSEENVTDVFYDPETKV